jgi:site-specific recombinase XerD
MGQLRTRMLEDLQLSGYSPKTIDKYLHYAKQFAAYFMKSPKEMGAEEIREFLLHLIRDRDFSHHTYRQALASLCFLYKVTLKRPTEVEQVAKPRRKKMPLPEILSGSEVEALLKAVYSPSHRAILMTMYASGLRVTEACCLKVTDIDSHRMLIHIHSGKGNKDRYALLAQRQLDCLREYYQQTQPKTWLFPGQTSEGHISCGRVRKVFSASVKRAGITKKVTPHILRHCFATHLVESGVDVSIVKEFLGHGSIQTTQIYTHLGVQRVKGIIIPFDLLGTERGSVFG